MENIDAATPFTLTIKQFMLIIDDLVSSLKLVQLPMKTTQVAAFHLLLAFNHLDALIFRFYTRVFLNYFST